MTCPFCEALTNFTEVYNLNGLPNAMQTYRSTVQAVSLARCNNEACTMPVVVAADAYGEIVDHWPVRATGKTFPDVPPHIEAAADEAHSCLSIGAHRGAIALARAVVESTAKERGVTKGSLMDKIDALAAAGTISDAMKDAAHEIRFAGNEVAHGDLVEETLSQEDAEEVLSLMDAILLRVYQEPAQVARVRERREARRAT